MLNAAALDQPLTFQAKVDPAPTNDLGEPVETWADAFACLGRARPKLGREYQDGGQQQGEAPVVFTVRYREDVTRAMRVLWRGKPHDIVAEPIDPWGKREVLEIVAIHGVRDGQTP